MSWNPSFLPSFPPSFLPVPPVSSNPVQPFLSWSMRQTFSLKTVVNARISNEAMISALSVDDRYESSNKRKQAGGLLNASPDGGLDLVDIDVLVVVASVAVLVEFDVVIDAFVTVAVGSRE